MGRVEDLGTPQSRSDLYAFPGPSRVHAVLPTVWRESRTGPHTVGVSSPDRGHRQCLSSSTVFCSSELRGK